MRITKYSPTAQKHASSAKVLMLMCRPPLDVHAQASLSARCVRSVTPRAQRTRRDETWGRFY